MSCAYTTSLVFICFFSFSGIGLLVASIVSYELFINNFLNTRNGLWRTCVGHSSSKNESCSTRSNLLEFKDTVIDYDIMLIIVIGSLLFTTISILTTFCDACCNKKTKCFEITSTLLLMLASLSGIFLVIYNEIEILKDTNFTRGWGTFTMYGGVGALLLASILSFIHVVFCERPDRDKVDSLVLRTQRASWKEPKYQPTQQYLHGMGIDNSGIKIPPPYTANVYVKNYNNNWIDR